MDGLRWKYGIVVTELLAHIVSKLEIFGAHTNSNRSFISPEELKQSCLLGIDTVQDV